MLLRDILMPRRVKVPLAAADKRSIIEELVQLLGLNGDIGDTEQVLRAVLAREQTHSTGIGHGLAVPHAKCDAVKELVVAVGKTAAPVDFDSIDGEGVTLVVLLVSPLDAIGPHIHALARISRLAGTEDFRNRVSGASSCEDLYRAFEETQRRLYREPAAATPVAAEQDGTGSEQ